MVAEDNETIILSLDTVTSGSALIGSNNAATALVTDDDAVTVSILSSLIPMRTTLQVLSGWPFCTG